MVDWSSSSLELARHAQERGAWSDEQLLDRLLAVLRSGPAPDILEVRPRVEAALAALPADATVTERIEVVAGGLPALSGPWATTFLSEHLARAGR